MSKLMIKATGIDLSLEPSIPTKLGTHTLDDYFNNPFFGNLLRSSLSARKTNKLTKRHALK